MNLPMIIPHAILPSHPTLQLVAVRDIDTRLLGPEFAETMMIWTCNFTL